MKNTQQNISMVVVGDSYTDYSPHTYATTLQANLKGVRIINKGIGGDTAVGLEKRFDKDVISLRPDFAYIMIGGNDILGGEKDVDSVVNRIAGMAAKCLDMNIIPILGLYKIPVCILRGRWGFSDEVAQERFENMNALSDKLAALCDKCKVDYVKIEEALFPGGEFYHTEDINFNDIHPSALGANKVGNYVAKKIAQFITKHLPELGAKIAPFGGECRTTEVQNKAVVVAGDCYSAEYDNYSWVNMAQYELPSVAFANLSADNADTQVCLDNAHILSRYNPDVVFAPIGIMDCCKEDLDGNKVFDNINRFGVKCWDIGATPVFGIVQPTLTQLVTIFGKKRGKQIYDYSVALNNHYKELCSQFDNVELIDDILSPLKVNGEISKEYLAHDKVHLSLAGAEKVGRYVAEKLKELI